MDRPTRRTSSTVQSRMSLVHETSYTRTPKHRTSICAIMTRKRGHFSKIGAKSVGYRSTTCWIAILLVSTLFVRMLYLLCVCIFIYFSDGALAIVASFFARVLVKIITDYTGCIHFRHPYVGERAKRASRENENEKKNDK